MKRINLCAVRSTPAVHWACQFLAAELCVGTSARSDVTHLLLGVPSFERDGRIRGGGVLEHVLADLPEDITVIGGNLDHPALSGYKTIDLLRDGTYTAENAGLTAQCALRVALEHYPGAVRGCEVLIIGWGRVGKCLASLMRANGAAVTVAARKAADRKILRALGYGAIDTKLSDSAAGAYRIVFNTVPAPVLQAPAAKGQIRIELASTPGMTGADVIPALGLPGKYVPEASGKLIADTVLRILKEQEALV